MNEHPDAWLTVTLLPATTRVAARLLPLLAVTETTAVPDPVRLPVTFAHATGDDALHAQAAVVLTVTEAVAAAFEKLSGRRRHRVSCRRPRRPGSR